MRVRGEKSVMAREFVSPRVGDSGWREGDKRKQGEVDVSLIYYSHRLKSELGRLRGRVRQAEKGYVWTSRFVQLFHGRLPLRASDFVSDRPVFRETGSFAFRRNRGLLTLFFGRLIFGASEWARICSRHTWSLFCSRCRREILRVLQKPMA